MAVLFVKEVPEELHRKLKSLAVRHRRSMAKEALMLLEEALDASARSEAKPAKRLPRPVKRRFPLTDDFIKRARREGRM